MPDLTAAILATGVAFLSSLPPADEAKVRAINERYATAWRKNEAALVRATFWPDAVLIPQGSAPIEGLDAINRFWWPADGPRTIVTGFTITTDEVGGAGAIAFTRGTFQLDFTYDDKGKTVARRNRGNYMMIFTRNRAGEWRISHRMWSDRK